MHANGLRFSSLALVLSLPQIANASPPPSAHPPAAHAAAANAAAAPASPLQTAEARLSSDDPMAVKQALDALAQLGGEPAASVVAARVRRGLPPALIDPAIDALKRLGKPSVAPVLIELTLHRRPQVRSSAIAALGALQIRTAQSVLLYALDDPSAEVRAAAVAALAEVGSARALPALFESADRGVDGALTAVGKIAGTRDLKAIMQRVKDGDVTQVKPALQVMLERANFPLQGKLAIVREVAQLGSAGARNHLVQWLDTWKQSGDPRVRQALFDALKRIDETQAKLTAETALKQPAPEAGAAAPAGKPTTAAAKPIVKPDARPAAARKPGAAASEPKLADARMSGGEP